MIRLLALLACLLTVGITAASAYIRHSQAGLGCEGWPACYEAAAARRDVAIREAQGGQGTRGAQGPRESVAPPADGATAVAIARGLHRISAMSVGLLAIGIAFVGWSRLASRDRAAAALALAITVGLAWLGRYTPHDLPLVTLANVAGGFALAGAFAWIAAGAERQPSGGDAPLSPGGMFALALAAIAVQTWLGVMIGARSAIAACGALDCVAGAAVEAAALDPRVAGALLEAPAARGLQLAHRVVAGGAGLLLGLFALNAMRPAGAGGAGGEGGSATGPAAAVLLLLALLAATGFTTVAIDAPIASATAHNALAALLVAANCATARRRSD
jgi:cytochrome c oxidase assembly protein subunit 15